MTGSPAIITCVSPEQMINGFDFSDTASKSDCHISGYANGVSERRLTLNCSYALHCVTLCHDHDTVEQIARAFVCVCVWQSNNIDFIWFELTETLCQLSHTDPKQIGSVMLCLIRSHSHSVSRAFFVSHSNATKVNDESFECFCSSILLHAIFFCLFFSDSGVFFFGCCSSNEQMNCSLTSPSSSNHHHHQHSFIWSHLFRAITDQANNPFARTSDHYSSENLLLPFIDADSHFVAAPILGRKSFAKQQFVCSNGQRRHWAQRNVLYAYAYVREQEREIGSGCRSSLHYSPLNGEW